jgi:gliding motility-associated-like protein
MRQHPHLLVEVGELHRASVALSACPGGSVLFRGQWLDAPGTYELQVPAASGCDTLYQVTVSELGAPSVQDTLRICEGDSVLVFGQWASTPGTYQQAFTAANGCDSLHTFLVEVEELHRASVALPACPGGSVLFRGQWLDAPGTYELQVPAVSGCDTLYQATVSELGTYSVQDTLRICEGDSVLVFGQWASTPGTFQQAFTAANGCDSLHTFLVEVEELHRASVALSACPGGSVLFRGQWLDAPGTYELQVPAVSGCDTLYQATVSELGTYSVQDTLRICEGDSVLVFGQWASTPGTFQQAFTAANGCDSLHTFLVEVGELHRASVALSACPGGSVLFRGQWLDAPGTYELQVPAVSGCDTLYQATVSELGAPSVLDTLRICEGDSVLVFGQWASTPGTFQQAFTAANGCDSLHAFVVEVEALHRASVALSACPGGSVLFRGQWLDAPGTYELQVPAASGCDTLYQATVSELGTYSVQDTLRICEGDSVLVFGQWASTPGTFQQAFTAANGCDSLHTFLVEVEELHRASVALSACPGGSVLFRGQWLDAPGTYELQVPAVSGCDTLYQATVSELGAPSVLDTLRICEGDSVLVFGQWASTPGTFQQAFTAANGCDSLHAFVVEVKALHRASVALSACPGGSVLFRGQWLDAPGTYELQVPAASGCDTLYQATVSELGTYSVQDTLRICQGDSVLVFGQWASTPGTFQQAFTAANGCDSLHTFLVEVEELHRASLALSACPGGSVLFRGQWLDAPGTYELQVPAASGCDTLYQATVSELGTYSVQDTLRICQGDSVLVFGQWASTPGTFQQAFTAANGCDSLHTFLVEVEALHRASAALSACPGESVLFHGQWLDAPGTYELQVPAVSGCDTLYQATVSELGLQSTYDTLQLCAGDSLWLHGRWATAEGSYLDTLPGSPCPVLAHTWVQAVSPAYSAEAIELCPGDSVLVGGQWVNAPGEWALAYTSASGCDSLHQVTVTAIAEPPPPNYEADCEALEIRAWTGAPPIWGAEWGNGSTERQAVFPGGATARLALRTASGCAIEYELALPRLPEAGDIPALPDTAVLAGGALAIQLGLDPAEWSVFWTPPQAFSCDTCLSTLLYADAGLWAMGHFVHDSGCAYEAGFRLRVEAPSSLYVPSAFSPNGDGVNDRFQAYGWEVEVRSLKIFDRWGGLLCHSTGSAPYWDGTAHGQAAQTGVYVYLIEYTDLRSGKPGVASGDLMLLR